VSPFDIAGLLGALGILLAYAGVQMKKLDPHRPPALLLNLAGASLVLISLIEDFNLAALLLEIAWIIIAVHGLASLALRRGSRGGS
jgi:hypothetical protein